MTEAEWLTCSEPEPMLVLLTTSASARKLWLFACSCCRRVKHLCSAPDCVPAVEISERFADGEATEEELQTANRVVRAHQNSHTFKTVDSRSADYVVAQGLRTVNS